MAYSHKFCFETIDPDTGKENKCMERLFGKPVERCPICSYEFPIITWYRRKLQLAQEMGLDSKSPGWQRHPFEDPKVTPQSNRQPHQSGWTRKDYRKYMKTKHKL